MFANLVVEARMATGFNLSSDCGQPLKLAAINAAGEVVHSGDNLAGVLFNAAIKAHEDFWKGRGHLTTVERVAS